MNKETKLLFDYIQSNSDVIYKISHLKEKYINQKDFMNQLLYLLMEILNTEKKFQHLDRKNVDIISITNTLYK